MNLGIGIIDYFGVIFISDGWFQFGHSFIPSFLQVYVEHLLCAGHCGFYGEKRRSRLVLRELLEMK